MRPALPDLGAAAWPERLVFAALWVLAGTFGASLALALGPLGGGRFVGALIAAGQGLVLRGQGPAYTRWLLWSVAAWVAATLFLARLSAGLVGALVALFPALDPISGDVLIQGAEYGALGAAQFLLLRPHLPLAGWWIPACGVAGAFMALLESPVRVATFSPLESHLGIPAAEIVVGSLLAAVYGAITAATYLLLRSAESERAPRPTPQADQP